MDTYSDRLRRATKSSGSTIRWVREWVPQDVVGTGRKCYLLKWVTEDMLKALRERSKEPELEEQRPEPATEMLFLCTYDGCGKTFAEAGALRKHTHIHGERQYICRVEGCGKKFLDSSKLKRHNLIHTGERRYICPHEGCGKAFSLDFNLRAHMKTHSSENYHLCPYPECGKRYTHECKLRTHIKSQHEKTIDTVTQSEKINCTPKPPVVGSASADRPYVCPYAGCDKAYIHEYKLNLHLRKEHPGHNAAENYNVAAIEHGMDEVNDQATTRSVKSSVSKNSKRSKNNPSQKFRPPKVAKQVDLAAEVSDDKRWPSKELVNEDSEETEEDKEDLDKNDWRYLDENSDDDETEDEDGNMWSNMI
ncbi:hypothetical protein HPP92_009272 [Vanilla planifolia]|uniref:C2H2-type domain-containing protein n=1 Tax=Vanilla planifolia TaxID=51239 RepID=A0A835REY8_VANPL|nr:hypothetical protein HPP92_009272 [Vanilla planifolia]